VQPDIRVFKTTPQGELRVHIFAPATDAPQCAIVFYVCGGWNGFDAGKYYSQSSYFASRGALCAIAEVRTIANHGTTPAECVIDAKSAIRWVRQRAGEFRVDPARVVACGGSAAGHVSLCTAMIEGFEEAGEDLAVSSAPNIVCVFNPAVLPDLKGKDLEGERVKLRIQKFGGLDKVAALSPSCAVRPGLPPVLIMHGDRDEVTLLADSRAFADAMAAAGNDCQLIVYPGEGHGFFNYRAAGNPRFADTVRDMDRFLAVHGYLEGAPTIDRFVYRADAGAASGG
jgi:acetyl esterase/lipase